MTPAIKFNPNEKVICRLKFNKPKEYPSKFGGVSHMYSCSTINNGDTAFFASDGLHNLIQSMGIEANQEITIEKVPNGEQTYFTVNGKSARDVINPGNGSDPSVYNPMKVETIQKKMDEVTAEITKPVNYADFDALGTYMESVDKKLDEVISYLKPKDADIPF